VREISVFWIPSGTIIKRLVFPAFPTFPAGLPSPQAGGLNFLRKPFCYFADEHRGYGSLFPLIPPLFFVFRSGIFLFFPLSLCVATAAFWNAPAGHHSSVFPPGQYMFIGWTSKRWIPVPEYLFGSDFWFHFGSATLLTPPLFSQFPPSRTFSTALRPCRFPRLTGQWWSTILLFLFSPLFSSRGLAVCSEVLISLRYSMRRPPLFLFESPSFIFPARTPFKVPFPWPFSFSTFPPTA